MPRAGVKTSKEKVLEYLRGAEKPVSVREIVSATGVKYNTVRGYLYKLRKSGIVDRTEEGWFLVAKSQ